MNKKFIALNAFFFVAAVVGMLAGSFTPMLGGSHSVLVSRAEIRSFPQEPDMVSLVAVGDIMLSRGVAKKIKEHDDVHYPFLKTREYLKSGDVVFGNLETAITSGREIQHGEMMFRSDPAVVEALKAVGFNVLSLANNHTPNFGDMGLKNTFEHLEQAGIQYAGAGTDSTKANEPVYVDARGIRFAFLAYNDNDVVPVSYEAGDNNPGTAFMRIDDMTHTVKQAKQNADFVIVSMHSGYEYTVEPNQRQKDFARAAIDAGAELVIGHHPHVVQRMERYNEKYIFYSLGNFVFDQMWSQETREGLILKAYFTKQGAKRFKLTPVLIEDYAQPRILLDEKHKNDIIKRLTG